MSIDGLTLVGEVDDILGKDEVVDKETGLTKEETEYAKILMNPKEWASGSLNIYNPATKEVGPFVPRYYQEYILDDPFLFIVMRWGRRTGKSCVMSIRALHYAFTHAHATVLVMAPMDGQVAELFRTMKMMVEESPVMMASLKGTRKNPHEIELRNGARIIGKTAGTKSGSKALAARGMGAGMIILDEIDYMDDNDLDSILSVRMESPDTIILCASTPTGRRGKFWEWCTGEDTNHPLLGDKDTDQTIMHEYHIPSSEGPFWNEKIEREMRGMLTESGYVHEIEAEFGDEEAGVFPKYFVDIAFGTEKELKRMDLSDEERQSIIKRADFNYIKKIRPNSPIRTMGVDFDKHGAGPQLVTIEFNPDYRQFFVIDRTELPKALHKEDPILDMSVMKIIELNDLLKPHWIYIDRGYGDYQLEVLWQYGDIHPESGLKEKLKGFQFGESIEQPDPFRGEMRKEPIKPFMINQTVKLFERRKIVCSMHDKKLNKEIVDYRVEGFSPTGQPKYSGENDHIIAALGLAVLAIALEYEELFNMNFATSTSMIPVNILDGREEKKPKAQSQWTGPQDSVVEKHKSMGVVPMQRGKLHSAGGRSMGSRRARI